MKNEGGEEYNRFSFETLIL